MRHECTSQDDDGGGSVDEIVGGLRGQVYERSEAPSPRWCHRRWIRLRRDLAGGGGRSCMALPAKTGQEARKARFAWWAGPVASGCIRDLPTIPLKTGRPGSESSVCTSSILVSTQQAFTAAFALLLVRRRFTAFSMNAVVLISIGAAMLGMNAGGDRPMGVTRVQYYAGFGMTFGAATLYGLVMPVVELNQARHAACAATAVTYTLVIEMRIVIGFTATAFSAAGDACNNNVQAIPGEAREFGLGRTVYYLLLVGSVTFF
ncbi:purine permease 1-like [Triticum aestivum]|uniref:purine permease 1-like n=1 Tax=Triticum aestivum TaxID=4565 RepID=UPI001D00F0A7|nr:purine permease 1-like [Triticum aestivum]